MRLTLTLLGADGPTDVLVEGSADTPLSAVAAELADLGGRRDADLFAGSRRLAGTDRLGAGDLRDGAVLGVGTPGPRTGPATGVLEVRVTAGPDAGGVHPLARGSFTVGRDLTADLQLADPDLSRRHARITVHRDGVAVRDLDSTNGTTMDGRAVGPQDVPLQAGARVRIGATTLTLTGPAEPPAAVRPGPDGTLAINRPPRRIPPSTVPEITFPAEPAERRPSRLPVLAALLPVAAGVGLAVVMRAPQFLLFTLITPVLLVGNAVSERRGLRRSRRRERADYERELAAATTRLSVAVADDVRRRHSEAPDLALLWRTAVAPGQQLWERRPGDDDHLRLRLGAADQAARIAVRRGGGAGPPEPVEPPVAPAVPAVVGLRDVGVLGLAGPRPPVLALARALVAQLGILHAPADVSLVLLVAGDPDRDPDGDRSTDRAGDWSWTRWLPHLTGGASVGRLGATVGLTDEQRRSRLAELLRQLDRREALVGGLGRPWSGARTVVVIDGAEPLRDLPGLARLLGSGPAVGLHALCIDRDPRRLPTECGATVEVTGEVGSHGRLVRPDGSVLAPIGLDGVSVAWAEGLARRLAPLRADVETTDGLPTACRLLPLLDLEQPDPAGIAAAWRAAGRTTRITLGRSLEGRFEIDLRRDGPHALVAGTTGAGKSELLQTIIASLAVANRPDAMTFVLIDYKGGAAFKDCTHLPHTVGMVTDLDGHLTERALASLNAELKRREHLLAAAGAKDIDDYWDLQNNTDTQASNPATAPADPLPRTILIIDEFASLVEELPDFVTGLVGIAMRGRSLGVHLILATQRPSGVVSPVIRANTNLRIALRVTDDTESRDVIDATDAARIHKARPGRAIARIGTETPVEFQSARVGGRSPTPSGAIASVRCSPWLTLGSDRPSTAVAGGEAVTDLQQLVAAVRDAAEAVGPDSPRRPWLPPLPDLVTVAELSEDDLGPDTPGPDVLPYALADHPAEQRRGIAGLDLAGGGSLAVIGGARSGRSALLRTIAGSAATGYRADDLHLWALDCAGGALLAVGDLPHCGGVCDQHDVSRGDRILRRLSDEVVRRQGLLARSGLTSVAEQRVRAPAGERLPWLLLLVDGWEGFRTAYEAVDHGSPVDALLRLVRDGEAAGLRVVLSGDRQLLSGQAGAGFARKLVLRLADRLDYQLAGIPARSVPSTLPDGRGLLTGGLDDRGPVEVQVALLVSDPSGPAQVGALRQIAAAARAGSAAVSPTRLPFRIRPLPERISPERLEPTRTDSPLWTLIGAGGDDAGCAGIDLAVDGPGFLIAGPARSGRSTALQTMAVSLLDRGTPIALLLPRRSPLRTLDGQPGVVGVFGPGEDDRLAEAVAGGPLVVLVDDVHTMTDAPAADVLVDLLRADDGCRAVIAAGRNDELGVVYRGLPLAVRAARSGLLLQPASQDGELLSVRLPRSSNPTTPGRGLLVIGGDITVVQVAIADHAGPPDRRPAPVEIGRKAVELVSA